MSSTIVEKKKRGRKKQNIVLTVEETPETPSTKPPPKKRGRKPKGGKIIQQNTILNDATESEPNIILHLKCCNDDILENTDYSLKYDPNIENIKSFNFDNMETNNFLLDNKEDGKMINELKNADNNTSDDNTNNCCNKTCKNELWDKLNQLKVNLHKIIFLIKDLLVFGVLMISIILLFLYLKTSLKIITKYMGVFVVLNAQRHI